MPPPTTSYAALPRIRAVSVVVRDLVRSARHELPGDKPMLRVPYDFSQPEGPVEYREDMIKYLQGGEVRFGRTAPAPLADAQLGERVLVRLSPFETDNEWWLCEVEEVNA